MRRLWEPLGWARRSGNRALLTLAYTTKATASPRAVWRVLTSPAAAARWLPHHEGWRSPPPKALEPGAELRFRSRTGRVPIAGVLQVLDSSPARLRAQLRLGLFSCELRFSLAGEPGAVGVTRIGLVVALENEIALVGASLDRFAARKLASEIAEQLLEALAALAERDAELPPVASRSIR